MIASLGRVVVSFDFQLCWDVRDSITLAHYGRNEPALEHGIQGSTVAEIARLVDDETVREPRADAEPTRQQPVRAPT
jgi:hypothetical protein